MSYLGKCVCVRNGEKRKGERGESEQQREEEGGAWLALLAVLAVGIYIIRRPCG
jgi:hypothetical protein